MYNRVSLLISVCFRFIFKNNLPNLSFSSQFQFVSVENKQSKTISHCSSIMEAQRCF